MCIILYKNAVTRHEIFRFPLISYRTRVPLQQIIIRPNDVVLGGAETTRDNNVAFPLKVGTTSSPFNTVPGDTPHKRLMRSCLVREVLRSERRGAQVESGS
jgi:hypothetical protein